MQLKGFTVVMKTGWGLFTLLAHIHIITQSPHRNQNSLRGFPENSVDGNTRTALTFSNAYSQKVKKSWKKFLSHSLTDVNYHFCLLLYSSQLKIIENPHIIHHLSWNFFNMRYIFRNFLRIIPQSNLPYDLSYPTPQCVGASKLILAVGHKTLNATIFTYTVPWFMISCKRITYDSSKQWKILFYFIYSAVILQQDCCCRYLL